MAEQDSVSNYDFNKFVKPGKFVKFKAGEPVTLRILTKDPVVQEKEFIASNGDINLSTKFCFIVWNFTAEKAQILSVTPKMVQTLQRIAKDEDFGQNLQACDIKISPEGEMLERVYDINVVRHSGNEKQLTSAMVKEAQEIDLDNDVKDNKGRLSALETPTHTPGVADAPKRDEVAEVSDSVLEGERINLDEIPF